MLNDLHFGPLFLLLAKSKCGATLSPVCKKYGCSQDGGPQILEADNPEILQRSEQNCKHRYEIRLGDNDTTVLYVVDILPQQMIE